MHLITNLTIFITKMAEGQEPMYLLTGSGHTGDKDFADDHR